MTHIQFFSNRTETESLYLPGKYFSYNICSIIINHKAVLIFRIFAITIWCKCPDKLSFFPFDFLVAAYFTGDVPAITFIYKIFNRNYK